MKNTRNDEKMDKIDPGKMDLYLNLRCQAISSQQSKENCEGVKEKINVEECCQIVKGIPRVKKYVEESGVCKWIPETVRKDWKGKSTNYLGHCDRKDTISGASVAEPSDMNLVKKIDEGLARDQKTWVQE